MQQYPLQARRMRKRWREGAYLVAIRKFHGAIAVLSRLVIVSLSCRCRLVAVLLPSCCRNVMRIAMRHITHCSHTFSLFLSTFGTVLLPLLYRYFTATSPLTRKLRIEISKKIERLRYRNIGISGYREAEKPRSREATNGEETAVKRRQKRQKTGERG